MIKPHAAHRVIETINVNGLYFADRRAVPRDKVSDKPQVVVYESTSEDNRQQYTSIDIWV